jgi:hypothetical protein
MKNEIKLWVIVCITVLSCVTIISLKDIYIATLPFKNKTCNHSSPSAKTTPVNSGFASGKSTISN